MRKTFFIFSMLCLCCTKAIAGTIDTDDCFTVSTATLAPGGAAVKVTISLKGSSVYYTAYNMDIHLPEGVDVATTNKGALRVSLTKPSLYPYTEEYDEEREEDVKVYSHTISSSYGKVGKGVLRIGCYSSADDLFTACSGTLITVYLTASSWAKSGVANITIDGAKLVDADGNQYIVADKTFTDVTVGTNSSVSYNISSENKYGTLVLPFDAAIPAGMKAYTFEEYDQKAGTVRLSEDGTFAAYTPYVVYAADGAAGTLTGVVDASKYVEVAGLGLMKGAVVPQIRTEGYILQNKTGAVQFYSMNSQEFTIPSGRCWLELEAGVKSVNVEFDDVPAAIGANSLPTALSHSEGAYNLLGVRVGDNYKGIVIINGKKYVNK